MANILEELLAMLKGGGGQLAQRFQQGQNAIDPRVQAMGKMTTPGPTLDDLLAPMRNGTNQMPVELGRPPMAGGLRDISTMRPLAAGPDDTMSGYENARGAVFGRYPPSMYRKSPGDDTESGDAPMDARSATEAEIRQTGAKIRGEMSDGNSDDQGPDEGIDDSNLSPDEFMNLPRARRQAVYEHETSRGDDVPDDWVPGDDPPER